MSDEGGFDACECIFNYQTVQRLLSLLRQTQAYCTDNECLSLMRLPGPESNESIPDYLFIGLAFVAMAILYLFRPNSLRQGSGGNDVKTPRNNSIGPNDDPPPPPPSFD